MRETESRPIVGSLGDLAATGLASEPTLRKWISAEPDQPWIIKRGKNGDAYEIDIKGAIAAWNAKEARALEERRAQADNIRQISLDMGLVEVSETDLTLSPADRAALMNEELARFKLEQIRGSFVRRSSAEAAFGDVLVKIRENFRSFSGRLAKKTDLSREQINALEALLRADMIRIVEWMEGMQIDDAGNV